jgi:Leucine-rich repeat (LRR) protein
MCALAADWGVVSNDPSSWVCSDSTPVVPVCQWPGVVCDGYSHVAYILSTDGVTEYFSISHPNSTIPMIIGDIMSLIILLVPNQNLIGTLPPSLFLLPYLYNLDVSNNQLTGSIPTEIGTCAYLDTIRLSNNMLTGSIPSEMGPLPNLLTLSLDHNSLTGSIPEGIFSNSLNYIGIIYLQSNSLVGSLPSTINTWLTDVRLFDNQLTGTIPSALGNATTLTYFDISHNNFEGAIPSEMGQLTGLVDLFLDNNQLRGVIPSELGQCQTLTALTLDFNRFSSTIPDQLYTLPNMLNMGISHLYSSGAFIGGKQYHYHIIISIDCSNDYYVNDLIENTLPAAIAAMSQLTFLSFPVSNFGGTLPTELGLLTNLQYLEFGYNQVGGTLPTEMGQLQALLELHAEANMLIGSLPLDSLPISLTLLDLADNLLQGNLSSSIGQFTGLFHLEIRGNSLGGTLPSELGLLSGLEELFLENNFFTGPAPEELCLPPLQYLSLCEDCGDPLGASRSGCPSLESIPFCLTLPKIKFLCRGSVRGLPNETPTLNTSLSSSTNESLVIAVSITSVDAVFLSCTALPSGQTLYSTLQVSQQASVLQSAKSLAVTVSGLLPLTPYDVYCSAHSTFNTPMNLSAVTATRVTALTSCCKTLSFITAPPSIPEDSTLATAIYSFSLSSLPSEAVSIVVVTSDPVVKAIQPSTTFNSSSYSLQGSFVLLGPSGNYSFYLSPIGVSASEYYSSQSVVVTISSTVVPAPVATSVQLTDNGGGAYVSFSSPTDLAGIISRQWRCDRLLAFSGVDACTCYWTSDALLRIAFPTDPTGLLNLPRPGDSITLLGNLLRSVCSKDSPSCLTSDAVSLILEGPQYPVAPVVGVNAPAILNKKDDILIDPSTSYGGCGRPWTSVSLLISSDGPFNKTLLNLLYVTPFNADLQLRGKLLIPGGLLPPAHYQFSLMLTNFLGLTASKTVNLQVHDPLLQQSPTDFCMFTSRSRTLHLSRESASSDLLPCR